jgi:hypothetical protein
MIKEREEWGNIELPGLSDEKLFNTNWNRKRTSYQREWFRKFNQKKANDPKFLKRLRAVMATEEYKNNLRAAKAAWWDGLSEQQRQQWHDNQSRNSRRASLSFTDEAQAHEIFWQCWGEDRGEKLYGQLAQHYGVAPGGIISLVRGHANGTTHCFCPVDADTLDTMKQEWADRYQSYTITAISPGRDLLAEYDELYEASDWYAKVVPAWKMTTPSVVYHCRYNIKNPTPQKVRDYCDSIGIPRLKNDLGQYKMLLERFKWLTKKTSKTHTFDSLDDVADFFSKLSNKTITKANVWETMQKDIALRDNSPFAGWIIKKQKTG